jgi:hypothetical protein
MQGHGTIQEPGEVCRLALVSPGEGAEEDFSGHCISGKIWFKWLPPKLTASPESFWLMPGACSWILVSHFFFLQAELSPIQLAGAFPTLALFYLFTAQGIFQQKTQEETENKQVYFLGPRKGKKIYRGLPSPCYHCGIYLFTMKSRAQVSQMNSLPGDSIPTAIVTKSDATRGRQVSPQFAFCGANSRESSTSKDGQ